MSRITKPPPRPKVKHAHEVRVAHTGKWSARQDDLWTEVQRVAGYEGFKTKEPFWGCTAIYFDTAEKASVLRHWLRDCRFEQTPEKRKRVDPYDEVVFAQYSVIWGLASGVMPEMIRVYRLHRSKCTTHGSPNWAASSVVMQAAPGLSRDDARKMVDAMLAYVIARDSLWWDGFDGPHQIKQY